VRHPLFARGHPCAALVAFLVLAFKRYQGVIILIEGCPNCAYGEHTLQFMFCAVWATNVRVSRLHDSAQVMVVASATKERLAVAHIVTHATTL
jgi:hypothetical protein